MFFPLPSVGTSPFFEGRGEASPNSISRLWGERSKPNLANRNEYQQFRLHFSKFPVAWQVLLMCGGVSKATRDILVAITPKPLSQKYQIQTFKDTIFVRSVPGQMQVPRKNVWASFKIQLGHINKNMPSIGFEETEKSSSAKISQKFVHRWGCHL